MPSEIYPKTKYRKEKSNSIICIVLCFMLLTILGFLPSLNSSVTQMLRPIMIALCFMFPSKYSYRFSITDKALLLYLAYFMLVFLVHPITKDTAMAYGAVFLFGLFFIVLSKRYWSKQEIQAIVFSVAIAGAIFAVIMFTENPDMLHNHPYGGFSFRGFHVNDNTVAFELVPGTLCSLALFLFHRPKTRKRPFLNLVLRIALFSSAAFCLFVLFCIGSRSGFFSVVVGAVCIVFQKTRNFTSSSARRWAQIGVLLMLAVLIVVGMNVTEGTHSARLFDFENLGDTNGREDLADEAWPMIHQKPLFGGGYSYWDEEGGSELGTHNTFLTTMVRGGYTGGFLLVLFLIAIIIEVFSTNNLLIIAFSVETVFHTLTESDLDYFAYIPLLLAFILLRYGKSHHCPAEEAL